MSVGVLSANMAERSNPVEKYVVSPNDRHLNLEEKGSKMGPKWSQNGAKKGSKTEPESRIDLKSILRGKNVKKRANFRAKSIAE